jgi:hypothetical protein
MVRQESVVRVDQIASGLRHPGAAWVVDNALDFDASGVDVDNEQDVISNEADKGEHFDGEKVGRGNFAGVCFEKGPPRDASSALWRGLDAVFTQDALDGISSELDAEIVKRTTDAGVAPSGILSCHADDQCTFFVFGSTPAASSLGASVVLVCDEFSIPTQNRIGSRDGRDLTQPLSSEDLRLHRESATLIVVELDGLRSEFVAEDAIFLQEVGDHIRLLSVHPPCEDKQQELQRMSGHVPDRTASAW